MERLSKDVFVLKEALCVCKNKLVIVLDCGSSIYHVTIKMTYSRIFIITNMDNKYSIPISTPNKTFFILILHHKYVLTEVGFYNVALIRSITPYQSVSSC